jgi:hypothetical protein
MVTAELPSFQMAMSSRTGIIEPLRGVVPSISPGTGCCFAEAGCGTGRSMWEPKLLNVRNIESPLELRNEINELKSLLIKRESEMLRMNERLNQLGV